MLVEVFAVCHNEEKLLPYFFRHYSFAHVNIYDNQSTDQSVAICQANGARVVPFDTGGKFREDILMDIRNNCWKDSKADWVIVCDVDEFVFHPNFMAYLETVQDTVIFPRMFNMFSESFPTTDGQIYQQVNKGVEMRGKMCLFKPSQIKEMNYGPGNHTAKPEGNYKLNYTSEIINLHFKNLGCDYVTQRNAYLKSRQSDQNRQRNWNWHIEENPDDTKKMFKEIKEHLIKIL